MKYAFYIFLHLIISTSFFWNSTAQQIDLKITADAAIPPEILSSISPITSFSTYLDLENETERILNEFQESGFIDSRLISITKNKDEDVSKENRATYTANYYLGIKFSIITIFFNTDNYSLKEVTSIIPQASPESFSIPISEVATTLTKLNNLQTNKGDAFARVYLSKFKKDGDKLSATLISETTTKRRIDSIIVKGYEKFPRPYLKHLAGLKKGTVFNEVKIEKAKTAINALQFASNIKPPEVLFKNSKTSLYLYLEKQKSNNFDGIIGFSTDEETNGLVFNGYLDLQLSNNLNFGESFTLNYKADGNDQQNLNVSATLPYLFKSPIGLELGLAIFRQAEIFSTTSQKVALQYQINPNAISTLNFTGANSSILSDEEITSPNLGDFTKNEIALGTQWQFYQADQLFPIKAEFELKFGAGNRITEFEDEAQLSIEAKASYILDLNNQNSFYLKNTSGYLDSDTYVTNELYRVGGINSIRGFNENAIETNLYSLLNTEYRYRLNNLLYIHSIIDIGYIENQVTDSDKTLYSFGLGTGFFTKTGLLRLSIANGKLGGQDLNITDLKIHLSLITTF